VKKVKSENVKKFALYAGFVIVLLSSTSKVFGQTRIRFAGGGTSATVSGSLRSYQSKKVYVIRVRGGQTLTTRQINSSSSNHDITIYIKSPSGEDVGDSDASCNNRREITPTEAGDYRIEVVECQKSDPWRGSFKFRVTVR
jgi:hypothetical protein